MRLSDRRTWPALENGFSLIEILAAIVVMGLIFAGFVSVYGTVLRHGSDAQLHSQAVGVASAYLDEILARDYRDPDDGALCGSPEADRALFDNICDYDALALNGCNATSAACPVAGDCACDAGGSPVDGLSAFRVAVTVIPATVAAAPGLTVRVGVTHDGLGGSVVALQAFRTED